LTISQAALCKRLKKTQFNFKILYPKNQKQVDVVEEREMWCDIQKVGVVRVFWFDEG